MSVVTSTHTTSLPSTVVNAALLGSSFSITKPYPHIFMVWVGLVALCGGCGPRGGRGRRRRRKEEDEEKELVVVVVVVVVVVGPCGGYIICSIRFK